MPIGQYGVWFKNPAELPCILVAVLYVQLNTIIPIRRHIFLPFQSNPLTIYKSQGANFVQDYH